MADIYVDSNATGGSQTGADWANAYLTLAAAAAVDSAGDNIWVASDHSESTAAAVALSWAGTAASPTRIISADKTSGEPPSTVQSGAAVATTGNNNYTLVNNGYAYVFGISVTAGDSTGAANPILQSSGAQTIVVAESCNFIIGSTAAVNAIQITGPTNGLAWAINCGFKFSDAGQSIKSVQQSGTRTFIDGGSLLSGGTSPTNLFDLGNGQGIVISGFDLSNASASVNIFTFSSGAISGSIRNSKLPASWSGALDGGSLSSGIGLGQMFNCSAGDFNYEYQKEVQWGTVVHETTLVKSSGASDGTTSISWDMTTTANAEWSHQTLDSPEIVRWNERVGQPVKIAVDILHDSLTNLQNDEIWLEVQYLGTSGFPLSSFVDDAAATYTSTPADQETSSATWTTTGLTNPNEQQLSVIFTPQEAGYFIAKVKLAKASYTVYVDPRLQVGVS